MRIEIHAERKLLKIENKIANLVDDKIYEILMEEENGN